MFDDMDSEITMFFGCAYVVTNFGKNFNIHGMEEKANQFVDLNLYMNLKCVGHNMNHTNIIQKIDQFHINWI
jgi:hypothetical protein